MSDNRNLNSEMDFLIGFQAAGRELVELIRSALEKDEYLQRVKAGNRSPVSVKAIEAAKELVIRDVERQITGYLVNEARGLYSIHSGNAPEALFELLARDGFKDRIGGAVQTTTAQASQRDRASRQMIRTVDILHRDLRAIDLREKGIAKPTRKHIELYDNVRSYSLNLIKAFI